MNEKELHKLKDIDVPEHSDAAKKQAITVAMQAFEEEQIKKEKNFQGINESERLIDMLTRSFWRFIMKKQIIAGTTFAAVVVIALSTTTTLYPPAVKDSNNPALVEKKPIKTQNSAQIADKLERREASKELVAEYDAVESEEIAPPASAPVSMSQIAGSKVKARGDVAMGFAAKRSMQQQAANSIVAGAPYHIDDIQLPSSQYKGQDKFEDIKTNPLKKTSEEPVSTFSIDVDTSSYSFMRRQLNHGVVPQKDAIRIEEMINYFDYNYPIPEDADTPFSTSANIYPTPWNKDTKLLHIGIKGHDLVHEDKPASNLVFLIDVSGSMNNPEKLPLLKNAFRLMVENLNPKDNVSIVTYAGRAATVLEPTKVEEKSKILAALEQLSSGGSTAGAQGIKQAYALAEANFEKDGVNRVILATDGDFNVGITNREELKGYIERKRESGIFLSVLGFGQGNYNDALMQALAQNGNGNAAYIDTLSEARKVLVDEASSTIFPIAKDVKIQIEFNQQKVSEYRLIGYETRILKREDFNNDKVDAGDIGAGHTVTAIYEITPAGSNGKLIDDLRYKKASVSTQKGKIVADIEPGEMSDEYAFLKLRYKLPKEDTSKLISLPITKDLEKDNIEDISDDIRFATSVAGFGQLLRGDAYTKNYSFEDVIKLGKSGRGEDEFGYRSEFLNLVRLAKSAKSM